jgi:hypothetical protein
MRPYYETPWDNTPIYGFNKKLGYVTLKYDRDSGRYVEIDPKMPKRVVKTKFEKVMLHKSLLPEFRSWEDARRK